MLTFTFKNKWQNVMIKIFWTVSAYTLHVLTIDTVGGMNHKALQVNVGFLVVSECTL